jgi:DNA polymerase III alpha subunit
MPDIDIDFYDRESALKIIKHIPASRYENNELKKHNTGIYLHQIPVDKINNMSSIDYDVAEDRGYFKIDFLNVSLYKDIKNEEHLQQLMNQEPLWDLLEQEEFSKMLFHVGGHGSILKMMKPQNVEQLAAVLAMIRPAKRNLIGLPWDTVMTQVWIRPENDDYFFKKSHAIAYAVAVVVQMNLICEKISYGFS